MTPAALLLAAPAGDDAHPGTDEKPWKTLQRPSRGLKPGDTVRIKAGEYTGGRSGNALRITQAGTEEAHSRFLDPGLVGPADARLKPGSPAFDAGTVLPEMTDDLPRAPRGAAPDIGAYEVIAK